MKVSKVKQSLILFLLLLPLSFFASAQTTSIKPRLIIPFGHQEGIRRSLFTHDNQLIITSDERITIISDVRSGKPLFYLNGKNPSINSNDRYVSTVMDTLVMFWDLKSGELVNSVVVDGKAVGAAFNPHNDLLLIESGTGGDINDPETWYYNVSIWDPAKSQVLHVFRSVVRNGEEKGRDCNECEGDVCPIRKAWFNSAGDSVRLVYKNLIKSYSLTNYNSPRRVCLNRSGNVPAGGLVKILNDRTIEIYDEGAADCFDEFGRLVASWTLRPGSKSPLIKEFECISPAYNYQATYTSHRITLRDLKAKTAPRFFEVQGGDLKKLTFNEEGAYVLAEYLDEAPRMLKTTTLSESSLLAEKDYKGLPIYVYETRTVPDAAEATMFFDSIEAKMPKLPGVLGTAGDMMGINDPFKQVHEGVASFKNDVNSSYTNSGEIVNLSNNRTISKIQSLIKLSGDVKLSPDQKLLFLNTGKIISIYSIPYAKILINLKGKYTDNVFSPDSRWLVQFQLTGNANIVNLVSGKVKALTFTMGKPEHSSISFSADSKYAIINTNDASVVLDVAKGVLLKQSSELGWFLSGDGERYGMVNRAENTVGLYQRKDSAKLFSIDLGPKARKKDSKQPFNYQISFAARSNALAIWNERRIIFIKNYKNAADTAMFDSEGYIGIKRVILSPNGSHMNVQLSNGMSIVYTIANKQAFPVAGPEDNNVFNGSFRSIFSGNIEALLGGREMVQFSETGDSVMACRGDSAVIYSCANGERLKSFKANGETKYFNFKGGLLVSYFYGQLKFSRITDQQEWFSMLPFNNDETVFLLPDGTYFGNKSVTRHLGYLSDARSLSYKQFDLNSNRPDIVMRALGNTDRNYLTFYDSTLAIRRLREGVKNGKGISFDKAPEVIISNEKEVKGELKDKNLALNLKIKGSDQYPDRLAVFINGNPMGGSAGIRLSHRSYSMDTTIRLTLTEGNNMIEVSVFDVAGVESYRQPLYVQYAPDSAVPKNVFFAGIGAAKYNDAGQNLTWAGKDIRDVLDSLRRHYGNHLQIDTLFNNRVTIENLRKLRGKFLTSKPDDIVIVYYSGHGVIDIKKAEAFFGTYDMDFKNPSKRGISLKDFNELMENIPSRNKAVFLDACHSGELNKDAWTNGGGDDMADPGATDPFDIALELYTDLNQGNGSNIIVAARGLEAAKECNEIQHGIFTYAVLNGITNMAADADTNKVLSIGELQNYVTRNVMIFSRICDSASVQRAATRKENEYNDWAVYGFGSAAYRKKTMIHETHEDTSVYKQARTTLEDFGKIKRPGSWKDTAAMGQGGRVFGSLLERGKWLLGKKDNARILQDYQKKKEHRKAKLLVKESDYTVAYEVIDDKIIFDISCTGSIPSIRVDVNGNGNADTCMDRIYKQDEVSGNLSVAFVADAMQKSSCVASSDGAVLVAGDQHLFLIPVSELTNAKKCSVNFSFYNTGSRENVDYPKSPDGKLFGKTREINF